MTRIKARRQRKNNMTGMKTGEENLSGLFMYYVIRKGRRCYENKEQETARKECV